MLDFLVRHLLENYLQPNYVSRDIRTSYEQCWVEDVGSMDRYETAACSPEPLLTRNALSSTHPYTVQSTAHLWLDGESLHP